MLLCTLTALKHENEIDCSGKQSGIEVKLWMQAAQLLGWKVIPCVNAQGEVRSVEEIHEEIWSLAAPVL